MDQHWQDASSSNSNESTVTEALARLEHLTHMLRRYGQMLAALTILTVAGGIALAFYRIFHVLFTVSLATVILIAFTALQALLLAVFFESRRKEGDVLFKEISDELQWHIRFSRDRSEAAATAPDKRPDLEARVALRSFAQTSDLPLIPGAYGPLFYAAINVMSVALSAVSIYPFYIK